MPRKDQVAVVTGASSGIGRAVALELARRGCDLAICSARNVDGLERTAASVRALGRRAHARRVDVSDREAVEAFAANVSSEYGSVHVLVNNAGVGLVAPIEQMDLDDFAWLMRINFWGAVYATNALLPELMRHHSHIANVSSVWGLCAPPGQAAYAASKFALRGYTESLVQELSRSPVSVSLVIPGGVKTDIARNSRFGAAAGFLTDKNKAIAMMDRFAITSADRAAKLIVDGMAKGKRRILVGPDARVMDVAQRVFPSLYQRLVPMFFRM